MSGFDLAGLILPFSGVERVEHVPLPEAHRGLLRVGADVGLQVVDAGGAVLGAVRGPAGVAAGREARATRGASGRRARRTRRAARGRSAWRRCPRRRRRRRAGRRARGRRRTARRAPARPARTGTWCRRTSRAPAPGAGSACGTASRRRRPRTGRPRPRPGTPCGTRPGRRGRGRSSRGRCSASSSVIWPRRPCGGDEQAVLVPVVAGEQLHVAGRAGHQRPPRGAGQHLAVDDRGERGVGDPDGAPVQELLHPRGDVHLGRDQAHRVGLASAS